jgi:hypothetical protein
MDIRSILSSMGGFGDTYGQGQGIHGQVTDNPLLLGLLDAGNYLRYGKSEAERIDDVNRLRTPGVMDAAYPHSINTPKGNIPQFDPAAAERYTSAYDFGNLYHVPEFLQPALHAISSGGRRGLNAVGFPGVGEERPELSQAEELGMQRGAANAIPLFSNGSEMPLTRLMTGMGGMGFTF